MLRVVREFTTVPAMVDDGQFELIAPDKEQHVLPADAAKRDYVPGPVHGHLGEHLRAGHQVEQASGDWPTVLVRDH